MFKKLFLCVAVVAVPSVCVAANNEYSKDPMHLHGGWVRFKKNLHGHSEKEKVTITDTQIDNLVDGEGKLGWGVVENGKIKLLLQENGVSGPIHTYDFEVKRTPDERAHQWSWVGDTVVLKRDDGFTIKLRRDYTEEEWAYMYMCNSRTYIMGYKRVSPVYKNPNYKPPKAKPYERRVTNLSER